ncbi:MAG TPA: AAA family ATPase [Saprospiraceae bacterium]|nr:AAA family ATPase [Saprospiraceae bacterium]HMQ84271.1 AAA family ATPase [Saprospiraceae bacterium]
MAGNNQVWNKEVAIKGDHGEIGTFNIAQNIGHILQFRSSIIPPGEKTAFFRDLCAYIPGIVPNFFNSFFFISGVRGFEERGYHLADNAASEYEFVLLEDRSTALSNALALNRMLEDRISDWIETYLGFRIWFEIQNPGKLIVLHAKRTKSTLKFIGEGLGAQQLFFIFLPLALANTESFFIEEPEIHLHPKLQTQLITLLVDIAAKEKKQLFFSSHSEHVLYAVLSAVNAGIVGKEQVKIFYAENTNGQSHISMQQPDDNGRLPNGLPGFFDNNIDQIQTYLQDLLKKL